MTGGFALMAVKKLKGARFGIPRSLTLETNAIGLGTMDPIISR
jgi:hypothetical protein